MTIEMFRKIMAWVLLVFGVLTNSLGLLNAILIHNTPTNIAITLFNILVIIVSFIITMGRKRASLFINIATMETGLIYFPYMLIKTISPQTFIIYTFIIPISYGITIEKKWQLILPILNIFLYGVLVGKKLGVFMTIPYTSVSIYCFIVVAVFSMAFKKVNEVLAKEGRAFKKQAQHDKLTKLYNRYSLQSYIDEKVECIPIMLDIDHFKSVNDNYGHDEGDLVLQQLAALLLLYSDPSFMAFRYGGEEFLIVSKLNDNDTYQRVLKFFNSVRAELETSDHVHRTISVGIGQKGILSENLIKDADNNLYLCKEGGRNCIAKDGKIIFK